MWLDDRPAYPMNFHLWLRFQGRLRPALLEKVYREVLARHPLLSATLEETPSGVPQWVAAPPAACALREFRPGANGGLPHTPAIDLRREPGLRLWTGDGSRGTEILVQLHHASCDGLGALGFVRDLLLTYAGRWCPSGNGPALHLPPLDPDQLRRRGQFESVASAELMNWLRQQPHGALGTRQFLERAVAPLVPHEAAHEQAPLAAGYPAYGTRTLSLPETSTLRERSREWGVTVNDLLARDLLLTLGTWRTEHADHNDAEWWRISIPVSLRTAADQTLPAANAVSLVFLDRRPRDLARPPRLLQGIHNEMQLIKRHRLALTFVLWLASTDHAQKVTLSRTWGVSQAMATCVFSNLGVVLDELPLPRHGGRLRVGDATLDHVSLVAPLRMRTAAGFSAQQYGGRLSLGLHTDPRVLPAPAAAVLLDEWVDRVRCSLRPAPARQPVAVPAGLVSASPAASPVSVPG